MLFIKEFNLELNTRAKLFTWLCEWILCYLHIFTLSLVSPRNSFTFYIRSHFTHYWLDNEVKRTSKRRRIFKLLTQMVFNFLKFSTLSQFFIVKLFNKSLILSWNKNWIKKKINTVKFWQCGSYVRYCWWLWRWSIPWWFDLAPGALIYSWYPKGRHLFEIGRSFSLGTSKEGACSRLGAYLLLVLQRKAFVRDWALIYSWYFKGRRLFETGRLFTLGTSKEGACSRLSAFLLLVLQRKVLVRDWALIYSWYFKGRCLFETEGLFTLGTSKEGACSRLGAYLPLVLQRKVQQIKGKDTVNVRGNYVLARK